LRRLRSGAASSTRSTGNVPSATSPPPPLPHSLQQPPVITAIADVAMGASAHATGTSTVVVVAHNMLPALAPNHPVGLGIPQVSLPQTQLSQNQTIASPTSVLPVGSGETTTQVPQPVQGGTGATHTHQRAQAEVPTTATATSSIASQKDDSTAPTRRPSVSSGGVRAPAPAPDESGSGTGSGVNTGTGTGNGGGGNGNGLGTPGTPGGGIIGKLRGFGRATKRAQNENAPGTAAPATRATGPTTTATTTGPGAGPASSTVAATAAPTPTAPSSTPVCPILPPPFPRRVDNSYDV
jgi:hypothetical protein